MGLYDRRIAVNKRKALNIFLVMGLYYCTIFPHFLNLLFQEQNCSFLSM